MCPMKPIDYKVARGKVIPMRGKTVLSEPFGELPIPAAQRASLKLDRTLMRCAIAIFGRKAVPNDFNELLPHRKMLAQVDSDCSKSLALVYGFVQNNDLSAKKPMTLVKRLKDLLQKRGLPLTSAKSRSYRHGAPAPKLTEVQSYWQHREREDGLSEAGWRYLLGLPYATMRSIAARVGGLFRDLGFFNRLAAVQMPPLTSFELESLGQLHGLLNNPDSRRNFLLAYRQANLNGHELTAEELDFLRDEFYGDHDLVIGAAKAWHTLVYDAAEFVARTVLAEEAELAAFTWAVPMTQFVTKEGISVRILANGVELLEEGIELKNCLRNMKHYAERASRGECLIAALRGPVKGTAEFIKRPGGQWEVLQVAEPCNVQVRAGRLWNAAQVAATQLNGEAS